MSKRIRRSGFTLVELLTVAAIVGVLLAVTIPAVQSAREAARGLHCKNNLKQIGLALHNYCESYGRFPSGWIGVDAAGNPEVSGPTGWGWAAMILPQLDQEDLYSSINFRAPILDESNVMAQRTGLPIYRCPSDPAGDEITLLTADASGVLATLPRANYVGNFGSGSVGYCQNLVGSGTQCDAALHTGRSGIFYHNSNVTMASILDGTSHTILVSERAAKQDPKSGNGATWVGAVPGALSAYSRNLGSVLYIPTLALRHSAGFSSVHPGMVQMLLADGHVRSVSQRASHEVLLAMATRDAEDGLDGAGNYQVTEFHFGIYAELPPEDSNASLAPQQPNSGARLSIVRSNPMSDRRAAAPAWVVPELFGASSKDGLGGLASLFGNSVGTNPWALFSLPLRSPVFAAAGVRQYFLPHHTGGNPDEEQHYLVPFDDETHATWGGFTPDSPGPLVVRYDFRPLGGFPNNITEGQKARAVDAMQLWSDATCGKLVFLQDTSIDDAEVVIIGTGNMAAAGCGAGPGILGCGGAAGFRTCALFVNCPLFGGVAWQNQDAVWDEVFGNGDPPGTFDYFTVVAQEVGHALGMGHPDDIGGFGCCGTNIMNGTYGGEQTRFSVLDISHIRSLYGSDCGLPAGWTSSQ